MEIVRDGEGRTKEDKFLENLEKIESTNKELYEIDYSKSKNAVNVEFKLDALKEDQITPVQEAAKDFINSMFKNEELAIKEVKVTNYDLVFKNVDEDPVNKLAINLLSTIAEEEGTPVEIAVNGLVKFLKGTDVEQSLNLEVTLEDDTVIKIDGVSANFTRDRALTEEEVKELEGLSK